MYVYPIVLQPRLLERVWGGTRLPQLFAPSQSFALPVGEVWAVHGGLTIVNGAYAGRTLEGLWSEYARELTGSEDTAASFPLLVKWLDTSDWLSVQVHPDNAQARLLEGNPRASGKVECWYVVEARPGAELICGLESGTDLAEVVKLSGRELLPYMHRQVVTAGDFLFVPAGTVHALGPGISVLEVQQNSDLTYRFYDWDRRPVNGVERPLHLEKARQALLRSQRVARHGEREPRHLLGRLLTANPHFAQELVQGLGPWTWDAESLEIVVLLRGEAELRVEQTSCALSRGTMAVIPAAATEVELRGQGELTEFMRIML